MANPGYVRSTDGDNADDGSTWALANADPAGAIADGAAGDRIWFSQVHDSAPLVATTYTFPGTAASPNQLLCGNDAAEPPTSLTTGAVISTGAGSYQLTIRGSFYAYGIKFESGVGHTSNANLILGDANDNFQTYDNCTLSLGNTGTSARIYFGSSSSSLESRVFLKDSVLDFSHVTQGITGYQKLEMYGGSFTGSVLTGLIKDIRGPFSPVFDGVDMSNLASTVDLIYGSAAGCGLVTFRNCKLPSSWSGGLFASAPDFIGLRGQLINCSASDTNYALWVEDYAGSIKHETTLVKDSGASDGTTSLSWKMATTANAEYPHQGLVSPEIQIWNETVGSSVTATIDILHDSLTNLQDDEVWVEVEYLGTAGFPLALFTDDAAADVLATPADQTASSATWTTTGMTNPNEQKLSVSFTPEEKGTIIARVHVAKASYTLYVDPLIVVS